MNWFKTILLVFARLIIKKYGVISWTHPSDNPDRVFRYPDKPGTEQITRTPDSESKLEKNPFNPKNTVYPVFGSNKADRPNSSDEISLRDKAIAAFNNPSEDIVKEAKELDRQREQRDLIQSRTHLYPIKGN